MSGDRDTTGNAGRAGEPDIQQALAMLDAFASVGATRFNVSLFDIDENPKGHEVLSGDELRRSLSGRLQAARLWRNNIVIHPRSATALLIQLDDIDTPEKAGRLQPYAFMTVLTSPGNQQFWLAVSDAPKDGEAAKQFRKRVRAGSGADRWATGYVRLAGSQNLKHKYAPDFPVVTVGKIEAGQTITAAALEQAGLIAPPEAVTPGAGSVPQIRAVPRNGPAPKSWPDYQRSLRGAPLKRDGSGPDRSLADFMWSKWAIQRGWTIEETAEKLAEVSDKAQEKRQRDPGYALLTARNAAAALQRECNRRQDLKSTADPR